MHLGLLTSKVLDRGVIELIGPFGLTQSLTNSSQRLSQADTGNISAYGLYIFIGAITLILLVFAPLLITDSINVNIILVLTAALFYIPTFSVSIGDTHN